MNMEKKSSKCMESKALTKKILIPIYPYKTVKTNKEIDLI